jgi:hypothetical protein
MSRARVAPAKPDCPMVDELGCRLVQIEIETREGLALMESCSGCDRRWWTVNGESRDLTGALDAIATTGRRQP